MGNLIVFGDVNIPKVTHHDEDCVGDDDKDYDDYNTPNTTLQKT